MCENCECKTVNTVHWFDAYCSVIPVNNSITLISPVQAGLHFTYSTSWATFLPLCVALQISQQFSPKSRTPTHWMPSSVQILTRNDHSRSFKVTRFGVNEEPLRGYIVQYNNCGLECEGSEDTARATEANIAIYDDPTLIWRPSLSNPREYPHKSYLAKN